MLLDTEPFGPLFLYSCPEEAPVKMKMIGSTARATVAAIVEASGIEIKKVRVK